MLKTPAMGDATTNASDRVRPLEGLRIVVAQEDVDELALTARRLELSGATVVGVSTAREAIAALEVHACDALVTDARLGTHRVFDVLEEGLNLPSFVKVPVIGLTAHGLACDSATALRIGVRKLLTKPVAAGALALALEELLRPASPAVARVSLPPSTVASVLVVDDDALLLDNLCRMLERQGIATFRALTGNDAFAQLVAGLRPSVILTDGNMPGMSGAALIHALWDKDELKAIPVVGMSGADYSFPKGVRMLMKPFSLPALRAVLEEAIAP